MCQGNSDDRFLALPNIRKNSMKDSTSTSLHSLNTNGNMTLRCVVLPFTLPFAVVDATRSGAVMDSTRTGEPSIYHINCEVLLSQTSSRCEYCKKHRKSLCALASRHKNSNRTDDGIDATVNSEFTNIGDSTENEQPNPCLPIDTSKRLCTLTELQDGLEKHGSIPSGMYKWWYYLASLSFHRMDV